ncbi:MAG: hypothetical protein K6T99_00650 [Armatimonadetes bacterium]|nr:hypothetical protein [Armatimonadota bacterium]
MVIKTKLFLFVALLIVLAAIHCAAVETGKQTDFTQVVIKKAIEFLPQDISSKLKPIEKDIISNAKPKYTKDEQSSSELSYFVSKKEGSAPDTFAETFRQARKSIGEGKPISAQVAVLGKLAECIIALSQPYHSDEVAFKSPKHIEFEKKLDTMSSSIDAKSEGSRNVDNPSSFAVQIAQKANEELKKLSKAENGKSDASEEVGSRIFSLAANSLASTWCTLLAKPNETENFGNYVGNKRSLKFHRQDCRYLPAEKNRTYFKTREEAINEGYVPCKVCKP